jgi:hypothetical protein
MPEIIDAALLSICYHLFSGSRIEDSQRLDPDPLLPVRAIREGASPEEPGNPRGAPDCQPV